MSHSYDLDQEMIDFLDLINVTLSEDFIEKWRYKFSERFLKQFQEKLLGALSKGRPLKLPSLYKYLITKGNYSDFQVRQFLKNIEIDLYYPLVQGSFPSSSSL